VKWRGRLGCGLGRRALFDLEKKMKEKWLTTEELSNEYSVTSRTVHAWVRELGLPQVHLGKKLVRYIPSEIEAFFLEYER